MKRNFTKLMAAFALLAIFVIPMGMRGQSTYTKVTETPSDWSGTYVIVADDSNVIFTGQSGTNTYGGYATVTITNSTVSGSFTDYEVEIEKSGDYYTMQHTSTSKYLGWTSGNSLAFSTTTPSNNSYKWSLSTSSILNANDNSRKLQYNSGSPRFACYTSSQKVAYLYKKEISGSAPTINAEPVSIGYDETSGNISYTIEPSDGASITNAVVTNSNPEGWLSVSDNYASPIVLSCEVNSTASPKTATVTLTCTYGDNQTTTKTVSVTQTGNPNAPGTQNNPYTVAQARAAIDANAGTQGVYATGIVSQIVTPWGQNNYQNITFDLVDEEGDEVFLQAFRCVGTLAPDVAVGDVAVVYGNLTKYGSTYEFAQNCEVFSLTHPAVAVEAPTFSPEAGTYAEAQTVTINCATNGATIYYSTDGTEPTNASTQYTTAFTVESTTTIKAIAYIGEEASTVATATYHINSQENPYTVAQALAFNEYPANGIYVHGIVSTAPTQAPTSNGELTYYISDNGEAEDELEVYKGKGLEQAAFTAQNDIQVGDIVTVYGNVQVYNSTIEFGSGNYLVSFERPQSTEPSITIANATVEVEAEGAEGTLTVTYENITEVVAEVFFCNAEGEETTYDWVTASINEDNNVEYLIEANEGEARSAYFKVWAYDDDLNEVYSNLVTVNQAAYVADYAELPFEWSSFGEIPAGITNNGVSISNYLKFDTSGDNIILRFNERPGTLVFYVKGNPGNNGWSGTFKVQTSVDGETYTDLSTYEELPTTEYQEESFANLDEDVRYIKWVYTEKVNGNVAVNYISLAEYTGPVASITVAPASVEVPVEGADGTLTVTYENITEVMAEVYFCNAEGEEATYDWIVAEINSDNNVEYIIEANEGEARTAYFKVYALDDNVEYVYSNLVTVSQDAAPAEPGTWVLTDLADLTAGDVFVIVGDNGNTYAMSNDNGTGSAPAAVAVTIVDGTISGEPAENIQWTINGNASDGYTFYPNGSNETWLYCINNNNGLRVGDGVSYVFNITDGYLYNIAQTRYIGIYNSQDWRSYTSINNNIKDQSFAFYKKVEPVEPETYTLDITGYGNSAGGYYLIATPVASVTPSAENGFLTDAYDLYEFDQSADNEWVNYETHFFNLVSGKGYLYASHDNTTLTFTGTPYNGNGEVELVYDENANLKGWNLIGNPFGVTATLDHDFFIMNETGSDFVLSEERTVNAMQGIFVVTESADDNKATFSPEAGTDNGEKLVLNVTRNRGTLVDRAMIRFGEGHQLPKAMMNQNNTKLYIEQANIDYAVVRSNNEDAMPVNFKAATNGTYTLNVNAENLEMDYLHLIDNMTGVDVDLLQTPSYTFEANTTDNANRFKLVYRNTTNVEENGESFAYFNGDNMVINNEGDAQLQVIDMTGRIVSTETISGNATVQTSAAPGVYMLRLVNGDNVKVQKIIIK